MTYQPLAETHDTGTAYFESLGLIGGSTGMVPLITASTTIPAFDDYDGTAVTITDSVAKSGAGAGTTWWGWDLASSITKGLIIAYSHTESNHTGAGFHTSTLPASGASAAYISRLANGGSVLLYGYGGGGNIAEDTTIYPPHDAFSPVMGQALYVDGSSNIQKTWVKSGTSQWFQVLSGTDSSHTSFQSCFLQSNGAHARFITPIMVWGA